MSRREQVQKPAPQKAEESETTEPAKADTAVLEESQDWLDEIDAVLEENAEEFVKGYVQKGGQ